jgi:[ribosomal protein S18]-alanine N-acetyltransferase
MISQSRASASVTACPPTFSTLAPSSRPDPGFLADPASGYFALIEGADLIGFRSFGADGQVPGGEYDASALDTGGGLRPDLTGQGLGREAIATGLDFGRRQFAPMAFRVTVATFNIRAQRVVEALGFANIGRFLATADGRTYEVLIRPESGASSDTRDV